MILVGDCLETLPALSDASVDAVVTDPPAGISFMGKHWDSNKGGRDQWIAWLELVMAQCLRVLKPGGHALVWALPRTSHWTATAVENAGFDIRDVVTHHFGSGWPKNKSLLKPASEHWILARKPFRGTVAANMLEHGTGALNIDAARVPVPSNDREDYGLQGTSGGLTGATYGSWEAPRHYQRHEEGRWPANLVLSHAEDCPGDQNGTGCVAGCPVGVLGEQGGTSTTGRRTKRSQDAAVQGTAFGTNNHRSKEYPGDTGTAARFFYQAKPAKKEKGPGNTHPTVKSIDLMRWLCRLITPPGGTVLDPFMGSGTTGCAAALEGFEFIGIEQDPEYAEIAQQRIADAQQ